MPGIRTFRKTLPRRNLKFVFEICNINLQLIPGLLSRGLRSLFNGLSQLHTHNPPLPHNPQVLFPMMGVIQILTEKIWCLLYIQNYILLYKRKDITSLSLTKMTGVGGGHFKLELMHPSRTTSGSLWASAKILVPVFQRICVLLSSRVRRREGRTRNVSTAGHHLLWGSPKHSPLPINCSDFCEKTLRTHFSARFLQKFSMSKPTREQLSI